MAASVYRWQTYALVGILIFLILGIPLANRYQPHLDIVGTTNVWGLNPGDDPHYKYRLFTILIGFSSTLLGASVFFSSFLSRKNYVLNFILFFSIFTLGTKNYPYLANGLLLTNQSGVIGMKYDPKALLPMTMYGEYWRLLVFSFYIIFPVLLIITILRTVNSYRRYFAIRTDELFAMTIVIILFYYTPNYFIWLID